MSPEPLQGLLPTAVDSFGTCLPSPVAAGAPADVT